MKRLAGLLLLAIAFAPFAVAEPELGRVLQQGKPEDIRLTRVRTLEDTDFDFKVPATKEAWEKRRQQVREQVLVANGLWPLPEKTPLNPVIHGKIQKDGYTIEKVFFSSFPGHYVTGNLYRPSTDHKAPHAGVLFAHGHWENGRMHEVGAKGIENDLKSGGEKSKTSAQFPLQAPCVQLARMGCVVLAYDMIGYADSKAIPHRTGFTDVEAELNLQSFMGLQTWNSIRALDFLTSLPDVDSKRLAITGASGGGTQTLLLGAIDDRLTAAFPAVMVSTRMQGGCICENCSYLRQGTGNVELAAMMAPRPVGISGAKDWTFEIETKGLPELKQLYRLYGAEDRVIAKCWLEFGHNYNQLAREMMANWFNRHLALGLPEPVQEKPFEPVTPAQLSVFDDQHPVPKDSLSAADLHVRMKEASDRQIQALKPTDAKNLDSYRSILGTALRVLVGGGLPAASDINPTVVGSAETHDGITLQRFLINRGSLRELVPAIGIKGEAFDGTVVVWVHPGGKQSLWKDGKLVPEARQILENKAGILAFDAFGTGEMIPEKPSEVNKTFAGYTFGYNRPLLAQRVHDILTAVAFVHGDSRARKIHLIGWEKAGPWVLMARSLCGDTIARTAADASGFRFESIKSMDDLMMLPGAVKYGGLEALAGLAAPAELTVWNLADPSSGWLKAAYDAAGASKRLQTQTDELAGTKVIDGLLKVGNP